MKTKLTILLLIIISCQSNHKKIEKIDSLPLEEIWGERLSIIGDFNGDGKIDTLTERFISSITNEETNKFYKLDNYDSLIKLNVLKKPICKIECSTNEISDLLIPTDLTFGLYYLKNEGDINGDGRDEIGLVIDYADFSSLNSYKIYSYNDSSWIQMVDFYLAEWDLEERKKDSSFSGYITDKGKGWIEAVTYENGELKKKKIEIEN